LDNRVHVYYDRSIINPTYNTDGLINWLRRARTGWIFKLLRKQNFWRSSVAFCNPDYFSISP